jgi:hypothetical protein
MAHVRDASTAAVGLGSVQWLAIALALVTGILHLYAGVVEAAIPVALAGVGYLGAIGLFLLEYRRKQLYLVGILYTAVQFPLWYVAKAGEYTVVGYVDKTVQVLLIAVLAFLYWRERGER